MKIALLTDNLHPNLIPDEKNLITYLNRNDIEVDICIWSMENDWNKYKYVIIRSTWDYSYHYDEFKIVLQKISLTSNLLNSYEQVIWNSSKNYLIDLSSTYLSTVPTVRIERFSVSDLENYFKENSFDTVVVKPTVGLGGIDTFKIQKNSYDQLSSLIGRDILIQPFLNNIITKGELSFICFNGKFSHAVVKKAKKGEFRVQDDHGGSVEKYQPSNDQIEKVEGFLKSLKVMPLYVRVDVVEDLGNLYLMELELIEPELFFRFSENGEQKFINALREYKIK